MQIDKICDFDGAMDRVEHDLDFYEELLGDYRATVREALQTLYDQRATNDWLVMKKAAHTLKGASLNVGANKVSEIARTVEMKCAAGGDEAVWPLISQLEGSADEFFIETQRLIAAQRAG
jgi:HPt (histidine-containing phosphotransfer) domain-containing protein